MRPRNLEKEAAIRQIALQMIAADGLENLSMQKLARAAHISPRTIYIKYEHKEDLLIKLLIEEVLVAYEKAVLENFSADMDFEPGVQMIWLNTFRYLSANKPSFVLLQYGRSSPLLNKAFQKANIKPGQFFSPIHQFMKRHTGAGLIKDFHFDVQRALMLSPLLNLVSEYFDYTDRPEQIITEAVLMDCCGVVVKGMLV
jgi:TetR/AcrR family transcriptional repressor of multidrug resistance operon